MVYRRPRIARSLRSDDTGAIAILVAIFAVVMFGFAAIIVDLGVARTTSSKAHDSADASALAAANVLYPGGPSTAPDFAAAVTAAKNYAFSNYGTTEDEWLDCSEPDPLPYNYTPGNTACITFDHGPPDLQAPTKVRVRLPDRTVKSFFGGVVGYSGLTVAVSADAAVAETIVAPDCVFCVLGAGTHDFGNGILRVSGGDTQITGQVTMSGGEVRTLGGGTTYVQTGPIPSQVVAPKSVSGTPASDPLNLQMPDISSLPIGVDPCGPSGPGRYGAITLNGPGTCTMTPGVYVFTEPLTVSGTQRLVANGVTFVFACGVGGNVTPCSPSDLSPGRLVIANSSDFNLTAPATGPTKGLAIYFADGNTQALNIDGASGGSLSGTIYGHEASFRVNVPACVVTINSMVVVADLDFGPGACFSIGYSAPSNVPVTSTAGSGLTR